MAYVNTTRVAPFGLADRLSIIVKSAKEAMTRRSVYLRTVRELSALSDRELADLGLHSSMIATIAMEAAYGK